MPKLDDAAYGDIADTLRARVAVHAPEWTDNNESDPGGEEIELCDPARASLPPTGGALYVTLHHVERPTHPLPAANGDEFSWIEEGFAVRIEAAPTGDAVALARLLGTHNRWRVD